MATIDDLNTSLSELSEQEAIDRIMAIRSNRRKSKKKIIRSKKKSSAPKKKKLDVKDLSKQQRLLLIKELEGML